MEQQTLHLLKQVCPDATEPELKRRAQGVIEILQTGFQQIYGKEIEPLMPPA
jgi:hypothetical protein